MKRLILVLMLLGQSAWLLAQGPSFFVDVARFQNTRDQPYVEIYIGIDGTSLTYVQQSDSTFICSANVKISLNRVEEGDTILIDSLNYNLLPAAPVKDTLIESRRTTLWQTHQIMVSKGRYLLQVMVVDNNAQNLERGLAVQEFEVKRATEDEFAFSDLKWVAGVIPGPEGQRRRISRDDLIPLVSNSAFINMDTMAFYQELYHVNQLVEGKFGVRAMIWQDDQPLWAYEYAVLKAPSLGRTSVFYGKFDISRLPSQSYMLKVELLNTQNRPLAEYSKRFFVYNSRVASEYDAYVSEADEADIFNEYSEEQLDYYIQTLFHISTEQERNFAKVLTTYEQKKNYLYSFWVKRKRDPNQEIIALWKGHLAALNYVNQEFKSTLREGWQTDRGRVFIKYGIPSDVERFPYEPGLVPYEIWRYDRLDVQANVIFVFYDPDVAVTEFPLLHSTKYGEYNNPRWRSQLRGRGRVPSNVDPEDDLGRGQFYDNKLRIDDN